MSLTENRVRLSGFLADKPSDRKTQTGGAVMKLRIGTTESWKGENGEWKEHTEWHDVVVFKDRVVARFKKDKAEKGDFVRVLGKLRTKKWTDKDGNDRYSTEIHVGSIEHECILIRTKKRPLARNGGNVGDG